MIIKSLLTLVIVLLLVSPAVAIPPAPTGGHAVSPSTPSFTLTVTKTGTGAGTVTAAGVTCGSDCDEAYLQNTIVFLFANAIAGSTFAGWSGGCTGSGSCSVTMSSAKNVTATFNLTPVASCDFYAAPTGSASNDGLSTGSPFRPSDFWALGQSTIRGRTLCLLDGTYQGTAFMIVPTAGLSGTSSQVITVQSLNEGNVFIDGQFTRPPFNSVNNSYLTFIGIDFGNSDLDSWVIQIAGADHLTMRRICASNSFMSTTGAGVGNGMVMGFYGSASSNNTFEDFCLFGTARNVLVESSNGTANTFRRFWMRWEGWCRDGRMILQAPYYSDTPTPSGGAGTVYEN